MIVTSNIKKKDGIATETLKHTEWVDATSSDSLEYKQLLKYAFSFDPLSNYELIRASYDQQSFGSQKFYDDTTATWVNLPFQITSTAGINVVSRIDGTYICYDKDLDKIPNGNEFFSIRTRVVSDVTAENFEEYIYSLNTYDSNIKSIMITPITAFTSPNTSTTDFIAIGINKKADGTLVIAYNTPTNTTQNDSAQLLSVTQYEHLAQTSLLEIEERVTILEGQVNGLINRVSALETKLKDLPTIIATVSADVSKLYVAR